NITCCDESCTGSCESRENRQIIAYHIFVETSRLLSGCFLFLPVTKQYAMLSFIKKIFKQEEKPFVSNEDDAMKKFLIVGLGNIGKEYENTRHNIGFRILDYLAEKESLQFETAKLGDRSLYKVKG